MKIRALTLLQILLMTALAGRATAALTAHADLFPLSAGVGQLVTVVLQIGNSDTVTATSVTPLLGVSGASSASAQLYSGPTPATMTVSPSAPGNFTYTFSITACGNLSFTGSASGFEGANPVSSNVDTSNLMSPSCPGTPTVTPTPGPIVVNPTAIPGNADARVLGNKFHPDSGGSVGFLATLPFGGPLHINIYDRQGKKVKGIEFAGVPGDNRASWDGRSDQGEIVGTGIYAVLFQGNGLNKVAKVVVIR